MPIYQAAFQMVSDRPKAYEDQPAFDFIKHAPATWDETQSVERRARRVHHDGAAQRPNWFLGSMTNWTPRDLDLPSAFLGAGKYKAEIYEDAADADKNPKNVRVHEETVDRSTHLKIKMATAGGFAVRLVPVKDSAPGVTSPQLQIRCIARRVNPEIGRGC